MGTTTRSNAQFEELIKALVAKEVESLTARINALEEENKLLKNQVNDLSSKQSDSVTVKKPLFSSLFDGGSKQSLIETEINVLNAVCVESEQIKKKENNVIIYGLANSDDDKKRVENVFNHINIESSVIKRVQRIKSKSTTNDKPAPLLIELSNKDLRFKILKSAKNLKQSTEYNNVFINLDLTVAQRAHHKNLIKQRIEKNAILKQNNVTDYYYGIRNNRVEVIKIK